MAHMNHLVPPACNTALRTGSRLAGKVTLVTGAASGVGEAIARRFQAEGAHVFAVGPQSDYLAALANETGVAWQSCDVTREADVQAVIERMVLEHGRVDIVVNAAGVMHIDDVADIEDAQWCRMLDVNLTGAMRTCRAALPTMRRQGSGSVVNVASVAAFNASPGMASYAASKAGLVALTRSLANRYGEDGIRANCLCPGWVRTPMSEMEMQAAAQSEGTSVEAEFEKRAARIALRRVAKPEEMASCALFLASDEASFVTGTVLLADGGARIATGAKAI
jgi:NAD(P)-dependent dehydrogenase (short-subunit alcohol dehydrogenase family)